MELRQLEYFLRVAEVGGFSAAAESLYISQSSLSKQIIKLEREVGQSLLDRNSRPVALTAAGKALARIAPEMVQSWRRFLEEQGRTALALAVTPIAVHYGFTAQLATFSRCHPQWKLQISERENGEMLRLLEEGRVELAFFRPEEEEGERLNLLPLCTDELAVMVPATHPLAGAGEISLADLRGDSFILLGSGTQLQRAIHAAFQRAGLQPEVVFEGSSGEAIASLVASGAGVSVMLRRVAEHLAAGDRGVRVLSFGETPSLRLALAAGKGGPHSPGGKALWNFFHSILRE